MSQFFRRKFTYFVTGLLLLSGGFLFSNPVLSAWDANVYNKPYNGTLTAIEWNNLLTDFPALWLPATFKGPVTIGTSTPTTLTVNGTITATNFLGSFTGTLGAQNVSSGAFGSNTGEGNYSFPGNVGIGTTAPGKQLSVVGNIESLITLGSELITNGTFDSALTGWTNGSMNTFVWDSGSMHIVQTGTGWPSVYTTVPLTPGNIYYYSIDVTVNSGSFLFLQQGPNTTIAELSTSNSFSGYFIASSDSANTIRLKGSNAPGDWNIDNISIQPYISGGMTTPFLAVNDSDLFAGYGKVGIGTSAPTAKLDVASDILRLRTAKTPASSGASGNTGDYCWDADYLYICVNTNTWRRVAHDTW